jgi:predicted Fe-Mo cluster-binding NifX family protein
VLIAVPNCQGRVSPVFDVAARLTLVHLEGEAELERKEAVLFEKQPDQIVRCLVEMGVDVLVCGAISEGLRAALELVGIRVLAQVCGDIETVVAAYQTGRLKRPEFMMPGCGRQTGKSLRRGARCRKRSNSSRPRETQHL